MTPVNFKANYLKTVYIPHKVSESKTEMQEASIVELNTKNKKDLSVLEKVSCEWEKIDSGNCSEDIYEHARDNRLYFYVKANHYYALTTQKNNFRNLNPDKIIGLITFFETNSNLANEIAWLQVDPRNNYSNARENRSYKNIGKTLVDFIKNITKKSLTLVSADDAIPFYEKQGFQSKNKKEPERMSWKG